MYPKYPKYFVYIKYIWIFWIYFQYYGYFSSFEFGFQIQFRVSDRFSDFQKYCLGIRVKFWVFEFLVRVLDKISGIVQYLNIFWVFNFSGTFQVLVLVGRSSDIFRVFKSFSGSKYPNRYKAATYLKTTCILQVF